MEAFGLLIVVDGQGPEKNISGSLKTAEILLGASSQPKNIPIKVSLQANGNGGRLHIVSFGKFGQDSAGQNEFQQELTPTEPFTFEVPVAWNEAGIPTTRVEPWDNFRVLILDRTGHFWQVEIGVATRGKQIFLTAQNQWTGWAVKKNGTIDFVPSQAQHNYPNAPTYQDRWSGVVPVLGNGFWQINADLSKPRLSPVWNPGPPPASLPNFPERGVVLYFCPVAGHGRVLSQAGEIRFIHWKTLANQNDGVGLAPMTWIHYRVGKPAEGQRYAPILSCKIA